MPHGIKFEDKDWETHINLLKPLALNQFLNTDCAQRFGKRRNDAHRRDNAMLKHGNVIAARQSNSSSFWYLACQCQLSREIGFVEESLRLFEARSSWIHIYSPFHHSLKEEIDDYHFEIPSMVLIFFFWQSSLLAFLKTIIQAPISFFLKEILISFLIFVTIIGMVIQLSSWMKPFASA